jgi:hypothetical protein
VAKHVFIAHPMSGDLEGNTKKVVAICRQIHSRTTMPVFPSFTTRRYLGPDEADRALAEEHIREYFHSGFIHELWLFGETITKGMWREIALAKKHRVPVIAKTPGTKQALAERRAIPVTTPI